MTKQFVQLYTRETPYWKNVSQLVDIFSWNDVVTQTGAEYLTGHGVSEKYTNAFVEAATRVNYAQVSFDCISCLHLTYVLVGRLEHASPGDLMLPGCI
jgi:Prenylcysteine lyase